MNIGISNISLPDFINVKTDKYNYELNQTVEMSELITCTEAMSVLIDTVDRFRIIKMLLKSSKCTPIARASIESLTGSTEVNIFSIMGSIVKGVVAVGKWCLSTIGKVCNWIFSFFRRDIKDARNDIDDMSGKVGLIQNDTVKEGISKNVLTLVENIVKSHISGKNTSPDNPSGMKVPEYKKQWFNKFNASIIDEARVSTDGTLVRRPVIKGGKIRDLGWQDEGDLKQGCDTIENCKKDLMGLANDLKAAGGEVKDIVKFLENTKNLTDKDLEGKAPHVIDTACICIVTVKDLEVVAKVEHVWGSMTTDMKKLSAKYVEAK